MLTAGIDVCRTELEPVADLPAGQYVAIAEWSGPESAFGSSGASRFVIDVTPPAIAITSPGDGATTAAPRSP